MSRQAKILAASEVNWAVSSPIVMESKIETPLVFDAFFTTGPVGLGIGLANRRTLLNTHGGHIWAENGLPGPIVRFTLPTFDDERAEKLL